MKIQVQNEEFERMRVVLSEIRESLQRIKEIGGNANGQSGADLGPRVTELELKMSKLWTALLDKTPTGQDKLSKFGRSFRRRVQ